MFNEYNSIKKLADLDTAKHTDNSKTMPFIFPATPPVGYNDYWLYSDIVTLFPEHFNPDTKPDDITHIVKSQIPNTQLDTGATYKIIQKHVTPTDNDIKFSRFGAWALLKQYPELIAPQFYMMTPGQKLPTIYDETSTKFSRIFWYDQVKTTEQRLYHFLKLHNQSTESMLNTVHNQFFGGMTHSTICKINGITDKRAQNDLPAFMPTPLLQAYIRVFWDVSCSSIIARKEPIMRRGMATARNEVKAQTGYTPEYNMSAIHVDTIRQQLQNIEHAFIKTHIRQK